MRLEHSSTMVGTGRASYNVKFDRLPGIGTALRGVLYRRLIGERLQVMILTTIKILC